MTAAAQALGACSSFQAQQDASFTARKACPPGQELSSSQHQPQLSSRSSSCSSLPESIAHLQGRSFDTDWYMQQCDAELVAQGVSHPVHSNILSMWSAVLTHCIAATARPTATPRKRIVLQDDLQPLQDLLFLVYSFASNAHTQDLCVILKDGRQRLKDVMLLADKYDMPSLLKHIDDFLSRKAAGDYSQLWCNTTEAVGWALIASRLRMPQFRAACESYVARAASADELTAAAKLLPCDSILRVLSRLFCAMQLTDSCFEASDRELQRKGMRLCAEAQRHHAS